MIKKVIKKIVPTRVILFLQSFQYKPLNIFPSGHFYSPVVSKNEFLEFEQQISNEKQNNSILGVNLNSDFQKELLKEFDKFYNELPFEFNSNSKTRYYFNNTSYGYTDSIILYSFIRYFNPKRITEIGSGYTSALMLDTKEIFNLNTELTFIEPYPKLLYSLLNENDKKDCKVINSKVQNVPLEEFKLLEKNDILFIDSSHVSKTVSDVNFEIFNILPVLKSGVIIHIHDVFYPFEYPKEWILQGRNWNEDYLLRAFLMYNNDFEILFFSDYMKLHFASIFENMPLTKNDNGANLWLRKK